MENLPHGIPISSHNLAWKSCSVLFKQPIHVESWNFIQSPRSYHGASLLMVPYRLFLKTPQKIYQVQGDVTKVLTGIMFPAVLATGPWHRLLSAMPRAWGRAAEAGGATTTSSGSGRQEGTRTFVFLIWSVFTPEEGHRARVHHHIPRQKSKPSTWWK